MKHDRKPAHTRPAGPRVLDDLLGELAQRDEAEAPSGPFVAEVVDDRHPTLIGRVRVREHGGDERWCPTLQGLPVRIGDRVLLQRARGFSEPLVVGVIDGFASRPEPEHAEAGRVELRRDEAVRIADHRGRALLEIAEGESGPVVRILSEDLELDVPGRLRLTARQLELRANGGNAVLEARDDVIARGEAIHLN